MLKTLISIKGRVFQKLLFWNLWSNHKWYKGRVCTAWEVSVFGVFLVRTFLHSHFSRSVDQPDYEIYVNAIINSKSFNWEDFTEQLKKEINFSDGNFEKRNLELQLQLLYQIGVKFGENNSQRFIIQNVITLMKKS